MDKPIVETAYGKVLGELVNGIYSFKGIRYGAPPVGNNRFMPPQKPAPWAGVKEALKFGYSAPQSRPAYRKLFQTPAESEDCLFLNIWTAGLNSDGRRPVMFWLHGGGFSTLSASTPIFNGANLARRGAVVVSINHRLGALGYTHFGDIGGIEYAHSGNVGMLDVIAALEWERESIRERTMSGRLQRFKDGCWAGGKAPYGYAYNKDTKKLVINETEARVVRRIFNDYDSGKTLNAMANTLNNEKVIPRGKNSKGWRQTAVRQVLLNPTYKGIQIVNRHSHISDINKVDLSKAIQIHVPALVSEQVWQIAQERLKDNKHIKPTRQGEFLLQGIISCGLCGYAYQADRTRETRYYVCRGRLKSKHIDGSPRCKAPSFKAEWLENEAWKRIEKIISDPNELIEVLKDTIENLRLREADLSARIKPIDERLIEIAEQKAKLADDWVVRHMNNDKFKELKGNLDKEEIRLRALRAGIDPAQIAELESTKGILRFWESQARSMAWNTENEDGSMVRLVDEPHQVALRVVGLEDREISKTLGFPASKRELLDKLQVKLVVFDDRIEINGLFHVEPINIQLCTSTRGKRGQGPI